MNAKSGNERNATTVERKSDLEIVIRRRFNAPARIVFEAWTKPELIMRWWTLKSVDMSFVSCEMDVRTGGSYRFVFRAAGFEQPMAFCGRYTEVIPNARLVWTSDEGGEGGAVTTVTFEERDGETLVVLHDLHPTKESADEAASGQALGFVETFGQLEEVLATLNRNEDT